MTLKEQLAAVYKSWDNWQGKIKGKRILILNGNVQPTILSPVYQVRITFETGKNPFVRVLSPELKLYPGKTSLPHVHTHPDNPLCLFLFEFNNKQDALAETIVIWITWWLFFYEIWAETGDWTAPGTHPWKW